jgi:maleate isomerase/arylmalonate decarboxylase
MPRDTFFRPYGFRAKLGLIVPPTNTVNEAEWAQMLPRGVTVHATRMPLHTDTQTEAGRAALFADVRHAAGTLAQAGPDVIVYACTAGSMSRPLDALTDFITAQTGVPAVATAPARVYAARALGLHRVALATPYHDRLNEHEVQFLAENGITVVSLRGLGIGAGGPEEYVRIARLAPEQVFAHCLGADVPAAQGLIISCTDFATLHSLPVLESRLGKPVISSNLASFWRTLRMAGIEDALTGFGSLLERA